MNKTKKLLVVVSLLLGIVFAVAACAEPETFVPPKPGDHVLTINDAYDWNEDETGSTRPELGGGYVPQVPVKDAVITMAESTSVRFAGGKTEMTLPVGQLLKQSDFDESTLGGHTVGGLGVLDEEGAIASFRPLSSFYAEAPLTVLPYWAPENGDSYEFGSKEVGDYFYDADGNDLTDTVELKQSYTLVDGYMGKRVDMADTTTLKANSYFRAVTVCAREAGQQYTYRYKVQNFGEQAVSFTIYQMFTGHAWADGTTNVKSDTITVQPGAVSEWTTLVVDNQKDDKNSLTLIRFDQDVKGFSLGFTMAVENTTVTKPAKITLDLPEGFTVSSDYKTDVRTNDKLVLPTLEQITNNTGNKFLYWVYADGTRAEEGVRIQGDITLKPLLTETVTVSVKAPAGMTVSGYPMTVQTGDRLVLPTSEQITNNTGNKIVSWEYENGTVAKDGDTITGNVVLQPVMSQTVTIRVELPDGLTLDGYQTTMQTGEKIVLPTASQVKGTIPDGRAIAGWYNVNTDEVITNNTVIDSTQFTIAPYFTKIQGTATFCNYGNSTDGKELVFNNVQLNNKPMNGYNGVDTANFTAIADDFTNDTVVRGGEGGYAELGNMLEYNGTIPKGGAFRCGTMISNNDKNVPVVQLNTPITFYYQFENFGDSAIHLTLQGVNSGTSVEGPVSNIDLDPGESVRITFQVTYKQGSPNKNVMGYFTATEAIENMRLGVAISVNLGTAS